MSEDWEMSAADVMALIGKEAPAIAMAPGAAGPKVAPPKPDANLVRVIKGNAVTHDKRDTAALILWAACPQTCDVAELEDMSPHEIGRLCTQALMRSAKRASHKRVAELTSTISSEITPRLLTQMRDLGDAAGEREITRMVGLVLRAYSRRVRELDALALQAPISGAIPLINDKPTTIAYDAMMRIFAERGDDAEFRVDLPRQREVAIGCKDFAYVRYEHAERRWITYDWESTHHALQRAIESNAYTLQAPDKEGKPEIINPKLRETHIKSAIGAFNDAMRQGRGIAGMYHAALSAPSPAVVFRNAALVVDREVDPDTRRVRHVVKRHEPGPEIGNLFSYDFDYEPRAPKAAPVFDAALARWFPEDTARWERLIYRIIGIMALGLGTHFKRAFVFVGGRGSGKSTLTQCIIGMLPANSHTIMGGELDIAQNPLVSNVSLEEFSGPNSRTRIAGKIVNYSDELESYPDGVASMAKRIISGSPVSGKVLYKDVMDFTPRALHMFACNDLPHQAGGDDALLRDRFVVLPMQQRIRDTDGDDPNLVETVLGEREAIIHRAIAEVQATLARPRALTWADLPAASRAMQAQWVSGNHYLTAFLEQCTRPAGTFDPELRSSNLAGCWDYRDAAAGSSTRELLSWATDWFAQMYPRKNAPDYLSNHQVLARELERIGYVPSSRTRRWPIDVDEALVRNPIDIGTRKPFEDALEVDDDWEEVAPDAPLNSTIASEAAVEALLSAPTMPVVPVHKAREGEDARRELVDAMGPFVAAHLAECYEACGSYDPASDDNRGAWDTLDKSQGTTPARFKGTFVPWLTREGYTLEAAHLKDLAPRELTDLMVSVLESLGWRASTNYNRFPLNRT